LNRRGGYGGDDGGAPDSYSMPSTDLANSDFDAQQQQPPDQVESYSQQPQQDDVLYHPQHHSSQEYQDAFAPPSAVTTNDIAEHDPFSETQQQRIDRWKAEQREQALLTEQNIPNSAAQNANLMATVSKGSRTILFFLLMWRDLHLFEMADQALRNRGFVRSLLVTPLVFLFLFNLIGAITSVMQSSNDKSTQHGRAKRRLKAILNADKLVEMVLLAFYVLRLTIVPSKYTPREIYVANIFHSLLFLLQCHAFTRLTWNDSQDPRASLLNTKTTASADDNVHDGSEYNQYGQTYAALQQQQQQQRSQPYSYE